MRTTLSIGATLLAATLLATGCNTSTEPGASDSGADVAQLAATGVSGVADEQATVMGQPCGGPPPGGVPFPPGIPRGCDWDAATSAFACGPFTDDHGITSTRTYAFFDASGTAQQAYDAAATASIRFTHAASGSNTDRGMTHTMQNSRTLTESGMAGAETARTWNGTGSATLHDEGTFRDGASGTVDVTMSETVSDVVVPEPRTATSWPLSGSITRHVVRVSTVSTIPNEDVTSVLTFNGTQFATLTIGGESQTIDLARPPHRRGPHGPGGPGMRPPGGGN